MGDNDTPTRQQAGRLTIIPALQYEQTVSQECAVGYDTGSQRRIGNLRTRMRWVYAPQASAEEGGRGRGL